MPRKRVIPTVVSQGEISRYRKSTNIPSAVMTDDLLYNSIVSAWQRRRNTIRRLQRYAYDPRIQKAVHLLVFALMSGKYSFRIKIENKPSVEEALSILRLRYPRIAEEVEDLLSHGTLSPYTLKSISEGIDTKAKKILTEIRKTVSAEKDIADLVVDVFDRTKIWQRLYRGFRDALLYGDAFDEIVYKPDEVLALIPLDLLRILPNCDSKGTIRSWVYLENYSSQIGTEFYPYQVLHYQIDESPSGVGMGLLISSQDILLAARKMERLSMVARETRSVQTRFHYPDLSVLNPSGPRKPITDAIINEYKSKVEASYRGGYNVDLYSDGVWKVTTLESDNAPITSTNDIKHFAELLAIALWLPVGVIDSGASVNRATLDLQMKFLNGLIVLLQDQVKSLMKQVAYTELYLKDKDIDNIEIDIVLPNTGMLNLEEASKIVTRLSNKYNDFPAPLLAQIMGIDWDTYVHARELEMSMYGSDDATDDDADNNTETIDMS